MFSLVDRVLRIAKELNYRPNKLVRSVFTGKTHSLALVLPSITVTYFPRIASVIEAEAKKNGYHLLITQVEDSAEEAEEIESLLERRVDGLILGPNGSG